MPLGHAAVFLRFTQREHVAVVVQRDAGQQRVDLFDHCAVPAASGRAVGREPGVEHFNFVVRNGLDGHIADAHLIGVVGAPALQRCAVHRHAALHPDGHGHADQLRRREEFPRAGDGIVVDDARRAQPLHPRGIDRGGGRIRRKRIGRMDMVVDILRHHGREFGRLQNLPEVREPLLPRRRVQLFQNGNIDHKRSPVICKMFP